MIIACGKEQQIRSLLILSLRSKNIQVRWGTSGNWNIKVLEANEATTIEGGDSSDTKTTSQKYIVIKLKLTNKGQAASQYSDEDFVLGDSKTKSQYSKTNLYCIWGT